MSGTLAAAVALALVASTGSGCGFEGEPVFAGSRLADVAPWQDVGPLIICDGAIRLAPISADATGLCAGATPAAACTTDGECRGRERCVCGRCTVAVCDSADECGAALICSFADRRCDRACAADADCARGESCLAGRHVCRGGCATTDDCQTGETCQSSTGLCVSSACADDSTCLGGRRCELQRTPSALAEPSPIVDGAQVILYFERTDPGQAPTIWRATSTDGFHFTSDPRSGLLPGRAPTVVRFSANGWLMLYVSGAAIERAVSKDGLTFSGVATAIAAGDQPSLVALPDGSFAAYFADASGVERALSPDGARFSAPEPVLAPSALVDPILWRGVDRIASPFAESATAPDGTPVTRLWFSAHGVESADSIQFGRAVPAPPDFSVGEAASLDGRTFVPYPFNPVFTRVLDFLTQPSELDPAVVTVGAERLLYYRRAAADGSQSENLAIARSPPLPR